MATQQGINMSKSIEFLRDLAQKLQTQDNAFTASPNYCIQERVQVVGIDRDYANDEAWFNCGGEYQQADDKKAKALDSYYDRYGKYQEGWTKLGYEWKWKYIGVSFLTRDAAHSFVASQKHNYRDGLRVYVDSHYRNREMREVRRLLSGPVVRAIELLMQFATHPHTTEEKVCAKRLRELSNTFLDALDTAKEPHQ